MLVPYQVWLIAVYPLPYLVHNYPQLTKNFKIVYLHVNGLFQALQQSFVFCRVVGARELQLAGHQMLVPLQVNENAPSTYTFKAVKAIKIECPKYRI